MNRSTAAAKLDYLMGEGAKTALLAIGNSIKESP